MDALEIPVRVVLPEDSVNKHTALADVVRQKIEANLERCRTLTLSRHAGC
jgi:hypothetical protein